MTCGCSFPVEDYDESSTVWREKRILATRKPHRCYECNDLIPVGSHCCVAESLYEGRWEAMYRCVSCATYAEYISLAAELCPLWGHLNDFVSDNDLGEFRLDGHPLPTLSEWQKRDRSAV